MWANLSLSCAIPGICFNQTPEYIRKEVEGYQALRGVKYIKINFRNG